MNDLHLENLKVGDKVVSIFPKKSGIEYGGIRIVKEWCERFEVWRYASPSNLDKNLGAFPAHGGCKSFMSKFVDYYFSANPKHILAAEKQHKKKKILREKKEAQEKANFNEFKSKFNALLEEYGASVYAIQTCGDNQGVEIEVEISIGNNCSVL